MEEFERHDPQARLRKRDGQDLWEIRAGTAVAEVLPSRGGLVTRFAVGRDEVLYMDPATLADRSKNVRGGVPVLFPIAGRLPGDRYSLDGRTYPMRQHGLARQAPWSVIDVVQARLTMEFRSSDATLVTFPFPFSCRLSVDLGMAGYRTLTLEQEIENLGSRPMPLHTGLHPYFAVPELSKGRTTIESGARTAYDNVTGQVGPFRAGALDLAVGEVDLHLLDHPGSGTRLNIPGKAPRVLRWSGFYKVLVIWTLHYKDFVCVEPWSAPAGALCTGEGLIQLPPGEKARGMFQITA
jgi:galactose mutarotase-like enzyme